jgi:hypothetical protein
VTLSSQEMAGPYDLWHDILNSNELAFGGATCDKLLTASGAVDGVLAHDTHRQSQKIFRAHIRVPPTQTSTSPYRAERSEPP